MSALASLTIMINVYQVLIFTYTRHYNCPMITIYAIGVVIELLVILLDNTDNFS